MGSMGCFTHADSPASAIDAVISFMKSRREAPSGHTEASRGNSRCTISKNPSVWASSSRLRQYCGPLLARDSLSRTSASSSLLGQTASDIRSFSLSIFSPVPVLTCYPMFKKLSQQTTRLSFRAEASSARGGRCRSRRTPTLLKILPHSIGLVWLYRGGAPLLSLPGEAPPQRCIPQLLFHRGVSR